MNERSAYQSLSFRDRNRLSGGYLLRFRAKRIAVVVLRYILLVGLCFMIIQPILNKIGISLMEEKDLYDSTVILVPRNLTMDNYRVTADLTQFPKSMINSLWTSLLIAVLQVVSCTLVGYGFARFEFPLKKLWFACVVLLIIVPPQTISTALYVNFTYFDVFGLIKLFTGDTVNIRSSLLPYTMLSVTCIGLKNGLYIYMLRQYFRGVPKSLEEAAYVDGCGTLHTFARVMLPDALPILVSCFLFALVWQWTDVFYTRNFLSAVDRPIFSSELSVILTRMSHYFAGTGPAVVVPIGRQQQLVGTGVIMASVPLIIIYLFAQKGFVESLAVTGTKM